MTTPPEDRYAVKRGVAESAVTRANSARRDGWPPPARLLPLRPSARRIEPATTMVNQLSSPHQFPSTVNHLRFTPGTSVP